MPSQLTVPQWQLVKLLARQCGHPVKPLAILNRPWTSAMRAEAKAEAPTCDIAPRATALAVDLFFAIFIAFHAVATDRPAVAASEALGQAVRAPGEELH